MADPSWRQLRQIPESHTKRAVLHALGIDPPADGISDELELGDGLRLLCGEADLIVHHVDHCWFSDARTVLRQFKLAKGTPSGELARWWLRAKGYLNS